MMDETNAGGQFSTTLTAVEGEREGGWLALEIVRAGGGWVNRPRLAEWLLDVLPLADGSRLAAGPRHVGVADVDELLALLESSSRRGPIFVAGTDSRIPFDSFVRRLSKWSKETVGLAQVIVLDPDATEAFSSAVGKRWATPAWTLRTYLPGLDLASTAGARANRILGTERLARNSDREIIRLLGLVAREVLSTRPTPQDLLQWGRRFERIGTAAAATFATPVRPERPRVDVAAADMHFLRDLSSAQAEAGRLARELARVQASLGLPDLSEASLADLLELATAERIEPQAFHEASDQLARLQQRNDVLVDEVELAKLDRLDAIEELEAAEKTIDDQNRRISYLTRSLVEIGRPDLAFGGTIAENDDLSDLGEEPIDFAEFLERLGDLEAHHVIFTGDERTTAVLQTIDTEGKALQRAWEAVTTLCDYVKAKERGDANGSVHKFLEDQPVGYRSFPVNLHAATETKFTKERYGDERVLPVPDHVDPRGETTMLEHFKLARISRQDPRLYYFDDTSRSGNIYVGYIGPHMTNSQTGT
ncbi:hypothetical protein [Leifsonia sp. Le1]|uniref:hypothetical protein n=1 Tax=Leifsonia sp. Le1 TaxID=3404918 RepID=UPI003EB73B73